LGTGNVAVAANVGRRRCGGRAKMLRKTRCHAQDSAGVDPDPGRANAAQTVLLPANGAVARHRVWAVRRRIECETARLILLVELFRRARRRGVRRVRVPYG
jgi:hypothetical protein